MKKGIAIALLALGLAQDPRTLLDQAEQLIEQAKALIGAPAPATGQITTLAAGGDLQAALNAAKCGDTIKLTAGATFTGNFVLPSGKGCSGVSRISVTTTGTLPAGRVGPGNAAQMPKLKAAPGGEPVMRTAPAAAHYALRGLELLPLAGGVNDILDLGDGSSAQSTLAQVPDDLVVDRCYIHGDPVVGQKRGVGLNGSHVTITNSYISGMRAAGQDSQAISGWNGPGPFTISNNYLEAASENVLFGGSDPAIAGLVPSNITITGNYITKPAAWRTLTGWNVKNALELKNAAHVAISGNVLENVWADAQSGFALVLTVRNQDGGCPQCTLQDVKFGGNVVRHAGGFVNILALDDDHGNAAHGVYASVRAAGLALTGNLVYDIDTVRWGGTGRIFQILDGASGLTIGNNTVAPAPAGGWQNSAFTFQNGAFPVAALVVTNNVLPEGEYGIIGAGDLLGVGTPILAHYAPGFAWSGNTILEGGGLVTGGGGSYAYPAGTVVTTSGLNADLTLPAGVTGGADLTALKAAIAVVIP